ncbi:reverse transcriptase domain, Reverse transcriptase zinc-binding domain protein [Artemisia annua]|uniref:Reverse transcriptase domain, Reverse transcriptase zinc-binding domain protein n=1 Tax=Artemisia annua TaxID=35608 RepID=A0A2U1M9G6_ARTAN|nr:reverse transcriptase domain, Reverse transcriptase zinc-binding domain protein [Artemisia annua]
MFVYTNSFIINRRKIFSAGLSNNTTVAEMVVNGTLNIPDECKHNNSILSQIQTPCLVNDKADEVKWRSTKKNLVKFRMNKVWKYMREHDEKVVWYNVVWFSNSIPRHAFIL